MPGLAIAITGIATMAAATGFDKPAKVGCSKGPDIGAFTFMSTPLRKWGNNFFCKQLLLASKLVIGRWAVRVRYLIAGSP